MKSLIKYLVFCLVALLSIASCDDEKLELNPTSEMSGASLMESATTALVPLNGIYRSMYTSSNAEAFGPMSFNFMNDAMAEDMVLGADGSGWFLWDVLYRFKNYFTSTAERCYTIWSMHYSWIANANYILAAEETMKGDTKDINYIMGQCYAIRAYSYFMLAQNFARTLVGHEDEPCVPIYTEPTTPETEGQPRSKNREVYAQIDSDINKAVALLKGTTQQHPSHISYATALGLKARIALVENNWQDAKEAAHEAISASGKRILHTADFYGVNDAEAENVLWGFKIKSDQATGYNGFFTHLDTIFGYGINSPKTINKILYNKMGQKDERRAWWNPGSQYNIRDDDGNVISGYINDKFHFISAKDWTGDYILMRQEELYLMAAEAECRLGDEASAKADLMALMSVRDPEYKCEKTGTALGVTSNEETGSLLEEIITQRRIELWGEYGRLYDLKRLHQGFRRTYDQGWSVASYRLSNRPTDDPECYIWVFLIPQSEFDGNVNMSLENDQNPMDDYK